MSLHLFSHNQYAYEAAECLMEEEGKAAIIHPTGTGKSFIAFQVAIEHSDKNVLWLAPSEYIYQTQLENLKQEDVESWEKTKNMQFLTYSKLMMNEHLIEEFQPDYIILDDDDIIGLNQRCLKIQASLT